MFDVATSALIRSAPSLEGLDLERLPEQLTHLYSRIVALRTRLASGAAVARGREEIRSDVLQMSRLAHTYGALALVLGHEDAASAPAAFVAATAHSLVAAAAAADLAAGSVSTRLTRDVVPPSIAASLLFVIAMQPADAFETSKRIEFSSLQQTPVERLTYAVQKLVRGELELILRLPSTQPGPAAWPSSDANPEELAADALWNHLYRALRALARDLSGLRPSRGGSGAWREMIDQVISRSVIPVQLPSLERGPYLSLFSGPHHLATLV